MLTNESLNDKVCFINDNSCKNLLTNISNSKHKFVAIVQVSKLIVHSVLPPFVTGENFFERFFKKGGGETTTDFKGVGGGRKREEGKEGKT